MMKGILAGGASSGFPLPDITFIGIAGFTCDFAADVKRVYDKAKDDPSSLDKYMRDESPFPCPKRVRFCRICVRNWSSEV